jgi:hypothetical protein
VPFLCDRLQSVSLEGARCEAAAKTVAVRR